MRLIRKIFCICIVSALISSLFISVQATNNSIEIYINGNKVDTTAIKSYFNSNGTLMVSTKLFEIMGWKVENTKEKTVQKYIISNVDKKVTLTLNSSIAEISDKKIDTKAVAIAKEGLTFVPLRFVSETLGAKVDYQYVNKVHRISITVAGSGTTGAPISGFVTVENQNGGQVVANINAVAKTLPAENTSVYTSEGGGQILYNALYVPDGLDSAMLIILMTNSDEYEAKILPKVWTGSKYESQVKNITKSVLKCYFPTEYDEVYNMLSYSIDSGGKYMNKFYTYDNREISIRTTGLYISAYGKKLNT